MPAIPYPCLEDGLCDVAVIRTTLETQALFSGDADLGTEMRRIVDDSRSGLLRHFDAMCAHAEQSPIDFRPLRDALLELLRTGMDRDTFGTLMKARFPEGADPVYRYELPGMPLQELEALSPRDLLRLVFRDLRSQIVAEPHYQGLPVFDRAIYQKYLALMFANYAAGDPLFAGD